MMIHVRPVGIDARPGVIEIVAELGERIVGTVTLWPESSDVYYATRLHVDRDHRRQKIGTRLMAAAEAFAAERNAKIRVTVNDPVALSFFRAIGLR